MSRALPNARETFHRRACTEIQGLLRGTRRFTSLNICLALPLVLILIVGQPGAIRFIHHAAHWQRFFLCSFAASNWSPVAGASLGKKKINFSQVFAGQAVGIKEVHGGIWLASFMDYDLGYFDLETRVLEPLENPFGPNSVTYVLGTLCHPCLRAGPNCFGAEGRT